MSVENTGKKGSRRLAVLILILCLSIVAAVAAFRFVSIDEPASGAAEQASASPVISGELPESTGAMEEEEVSLHAYNIEIPGSYLTEAVALSEEENAWAGTPAYVFVAKKAPSEDERAPINAVAELLSAAKAAAADWDVTNEDGSPFLSSCQCIQEGEYVIIIGNSKYEPLASMFEAAATDPTVLDMDDMIARLVSFVPSEESESLQTGG